MIIGFIGFGKVSKTLFNLLDSKDIICITSPEQRSDKTVENIRDSGIEVFESIKEVAAASDILISATSPKSALDVARKYGGYCRGIYLDL